MRAGRIAAALAGAASLAAASLAAPAPAAAQGAPPSLQDEAVEWTREYLRVNTVNPPGNEIAGARFFARIFEAEGIPYEIVESAPGRGNIWARLEGGDEPALVLLHHMDVVPADAEHWEHDPLSGDLVDGVIHGRGALDTKTLGVLHLAAFLNLHRSGARLNRDVIFMATADEEAGGFFGAGWLVENRPELFEDVGMLLNEGGGGTVEDGRTAFSIEVTQKVPHWLRLVARGEPGHGSSPKVFTAPGRLVRALERIRTHAFEPRVVPAVERYFHGLADGVPERWSERFRAIGETIVDADDMLELQLWQPGLHALLRNTCSITMLEGSDKVNVVPPTASAQIDCRMLPDQDPSDFLDELRTVIDDPDVEIEPIMVFTPAVSSVESPLYRSLVETTREHYPDAAIIPAVSTGFTDSHFFRDLGIDSFGYAPMVLTPEVDATVHGNDERVPEAEVRRGTVIMVDVLDRLVRVDAAS